MQIKWLGGAEEVGRSCVYVKENNFKCIIDCGVKLSSDDMYPDLSDINFSELDAIIVSHGHLDHCGYVPFFFAHGYNGPVYATHPTRRISKVIQEDFAYIQKEETGWAPYWRDDVRNTKKHTVALDYNEKIEIGKNIFLTFYNAGHILGSAQVLLETPAQSLLYSGDINTSKSRVMRVADTNIITDTLILESTYGKNNDVHEPIEDNEKRLIEIINETIEHGGKVVIPVFAIGRAQNILMSLKRACEAGDLHCPIFLDGMLTQINQIYDDYPEWMNDEMYDLFKKGNPFESPFFTNVHQRKKVLNLTEPAVIVTTAGMMSGGPVLSYFKKWAAESSNTFALVGYQVEGTLGRMLVDGQRRVVVDDKEVDVNAKIASINFSAHADSNGLVSHAKNLKKMPKNIFLNHGEPESVRELAEALGESAVVAKLNTTYTIKEARTGFEPIEPTFTEEKIQLVITTPRDEIIKGYLIQMIRSTRKHMRISGYVDTALTNELIKAMRRGVKLSILFRHITRPSNKDAFQILKSHGAKISENKDMHARIVISDNRYAFISSSDLTRDSFYDHFEAGFLVKDEDKVEKVISFYEKVWQESCEL